MNNEKKRLEVIWDPKSEKVEIHLNSVGIAYLKQILQKLEELDSPDHIHLMTPSWGGEELTEPPNGHGGHPVNHLKLCKW